MDRSYVDLTRLYVLYQAGAFLVTRAKSNRGCPPLYSAPTDRATGINADRTIALDVMWLLLKPLRWLNYAARGGSVPSGKGS